MPSYIMQTQLSPEALKRPESVAELNRQVEANEVLTPFTPRVGSLVDEKVMEGLMAMQSLDNVRQ